MERLEVVKAHIAYYLERHDRLTVAIEGSCTAGKTTLAGALAEVFDCNVFHMDDFFLRPEQRTPERYAQVGGNVDYERFQEEVLLPLKEGKAFSYRPFDCKSFTLSEPVQIAVKKLNIIEGSYSMHPYFGEAYDLKILLTVDPELQHRRVLQRPAFLQEKFFTLWIPMEKRYLEHFRIADRADMIL
jgi:uridine kinase